MQRSGKVWSEEQAMVKVVRMAGRMLREQEGAVVLIDSRYTEEKDNSERGIFSHLPLWI